MSFIEIPVKKKVAEQAEDLSDILNSAEIQESPTVRASFTIDGIGSVSEAKDERFKDVCIIEFNGYFYTALVSYDKVMSGVSKHEEVVIVE